MRCIAPPEFGILVRTSPVSLFKSSLSGHRRDLKAVGIVPLDDLPDMPTKMIGKVV